MSWARRLVGAAGMILVLAAGCVFSGNFLASSNRGGPAAAPEPGGDRVVAASVAAVTASTQASLRALGIQAVASRQGEEVHIDWVGDGGLRMSFVLTSVRTAKGETTRVHFECEDGADKQAGLKVLGDVEAKHGKAG